MVEYRFPRPAFTADVVALARIDGGLSVLLIRRGSEPFAGRWALPGGFVDEGERPEDAARRELAEETGLMLDGALELVGVYGDPGRDPRGWTISAAYRVVLEGPAEVAGADDAAEARWFATHDLPPLVFDHDRIVADALHGLDPGTS
jgi:8-oxo-dGTP diphosphatase